MMVKISLRFKIESDICARIRGSGTLPERRLIKFHKAGAEKKEWKLVLHRRDMGPYEAKCGTETVRGRIVGYTFLSIEFWHAKKNRRATERLNADDLMRNELCRELLARRRAAKVRRFDSYEPGNASTIQEW